MFEAFTDGTADGDINMFGKCEVGGKNLGLEEGKYVISFNGSENPESYRKGQYLVANAFWNVSSNLQVGVEYLRGWRTDFSSATRHANRLNMLVQYSF